MPKAADFFAGGGAMGALMRSRDWAATPLGPPESWPRGLRTAVSIVLGSRYPMFVWWGEGLINFYNDAYIPVLGARHPRALGHPAREVWSEIWQVVGPQADIVLHTGEATWNDRQLLVMQRNGYTEETYFSWSYSPVRDESGAVNGVFCACTEDTERVLGERRLRTLSDLGTGTREESGVQAACEAAARQLEGNPHDLPFAAVYLLDDGAGEARLAAGVRIDAHPDIFPAALALGAPPWPLAQAAASGEAQMVQGLSALKHITSTPWPEALEQAIVLPLAAAERDTAGGFFIAGISARRTFDAAYRSFLDLVGGHIARTLTGARAYEAEKRRAESLAEIDRAKTAFFSNVSHEFRTPLTLILGPLNDLLARPDAAETETLRVMQRNGQRLLKLVNTLLDFARIEAGRAQSSYEPTDLAAYTGELASNFRSACERAGLQLEIDCPPLAEPAHVDREMWEKIVLNLLSNAFKFTLAGRIRVRLRSTGAYFRLEVQDTGSGIPAAELPRMFERFHRVEGTLGRSHEGSGIGLALVQELVKLHGGSIGVESELAVGSTFTVSIPRGTAHLPVAPIHAPRAAATPLRAGAYVDEALSWLPAPTHAGAAPAQASGKGGPRILLADDNADLREYARRLLAEHYVVEAVADGQAALAAARARRPDLVVSDVMMPRLDGFGLLRALRADPALRDVPIVLLSARAGEEARIEGLGEGADDYLVKPFSARELLVRVGALLESSELRRRALEALRDSGRTLKTLLDQAPLGVYLVDADLRIREVNPIAMPVFGEISGGVIGRDFDEVIHILWDKAYADEVASIFRHTLETGEPYFTPERGERRVDRGVTEYYEWRLDRIPLPDGRNGVVCYFRDISSHVLARKAIEESREALREADERKDEFLATLSHELRNPLAPLSNALQLFKLTGAGGADARPLREMMERQVSHLVRLVDDLLEMARITRGRLDLRRERVEVATVVRNAVETSHPLIDAAGHTLTVTLPAQPLWLDGDPVRLAQIVANLINNAAKYTQRDGIVMVQARTEGAMASITVSDNGPGIAPDALATIFEMFNRGPHGAAAQAHGGLGIGLALARRLAQMHGGTLEAHSDGRGTGAEFTLRLPLATGEVAPLDLRAKLDAPLPVKRVLVVDDNRDAADSLAMLLKFLGADVHVANDGESALAAFETHRPAAVLLDIGMPGMDGYAVARNLRQKPAGRGVAIVAITGWGQEDDRRRAREAGFDHHLVKPPDMAALRSLLGSLH